MPKNKFDWKKVLPYAGLFALAALPFLCLMYFPDYVYDDVEFIDVNPDLAKVRTFADCFRFELQASKPITNFFLAFGYWLGGGQTWAQRLISLLLHGAVTLLLFLNLRRLVERLKIKLSPNLAFWATALFAVAPLHSETVGIAQFRGEILGMLFALVAFYGAQNLSRGVPYAISVFVGAVLAELSKESFFIVVPAGTLLFYTLGDAKYFKKREFWRFVGGLLFVQLCVAGFLLFNLRRDQGASYSYSGIAGWGALHGRFHLELAMRALVEGIVKIVGGQGLTVTRISLRHGPVAHWPTWAYSMLLAASLGVAYAVVRRPGWVRLCGGLFLASAVFYLGVPNQNIGSEHYWYFAIAPFWALTAYAIYLAVKRFKLSPRVATAIFASYLIYCGIALESRLFEMRSRLIFNLATVQLHPESVPAWLDVAGALIVRGAPPEEVWKYIEQAKKRRAIYGDTDPLVAITEFYFHHWTKNSRLAEEALHRAATFQVSRRRIARLYSNLSVLKVEEGDCTGGEKSLDEARHLDPENAGLVFLSRELSSYRAKNPQQCRK